MNIDMEKVKNLKVPATGWGFRREIYCNTENPEIFYAEKSYVEYDFPQHQFDIAWADVLLDSWQFEASSASKRNRPDLTGVFALAANMLQSTEDFLDHERVVHSIRIDDQDLQQSEKTPWTVQSAIAAEYSGPRVAERFVTTQLAFILNYAMTGNSYGSEEISFQPDVDLGTDIEGMRENHTREIFPESMKQNSFSTLYLKQSSKLTPGDATYIPLFYITGSNYVVGQQIMHTLEARVLSGLRNSAIPYGFGSRFPFEDREVQGLSEFLTAYFAAGFPVVSLLQNEQGIVYVNPFNSDAEGYVPAEFFKTDPEAYSLRSKLAELVVLTEKSFREANSDSRLIVLIEKLADDIYYSLLSKGVDLERYQRPERLDRMRPWEMVVGISRNIEYMLNATYIRSTFEEMVNRLPVTLVGESEEGEETVIFAHGKVPESDVPFWVLRQMFVTLEKHLGLYYSPDEKDEILHKNGFSTDTFDAGFDWE